MHPPFLRINAGQGLVYFLCTKYIDSQFFSVFITLQSKSTVVVKQNLKILRKCYENVLSCLISPTDVYMEKNMLFKHLSLF